MKLVELVIQEHVSKEKLEQVRVPKQSVGVREKHKKASFKKRLMKQRVKCLKEESLFDTINENICKI